MFTGLIQDIGVVRQVNRQGDIARLWIQTRLPTEGFQTGESIAVDGVCLSVVEAGSGVFQVELSPETTGRTTLGEARIGRKVNLERALRPSDRLGGHLVTGHIDGIGKIQRRDKGIHHLEIGIQIPPFIGRYIVEKGSVAVDGVSLTVNSCSLEGFSLTLIPLTIRDTTLGGKAVGEPVNIECDILGKYVEKLLLGWSGKAPSERGKVTEDYLKEHGFIR